VWDVLLVVSQLFFLLFGFAAVYFPGVRNLPTPSRLAAAFLAGAFLLSIEATLLSLLGLQWNILTLALPLVALNAFLVWRRKGDWRATAMERAGAGFTIACTLVSLAAAAHMVLRLLTGRATSVDYIFFWGVKALRFANVSGIEHELLSWTFAIHTHPNYPPLVPVTLAWGAILTGHLPWLGAVFTSILWLLAGALVLHGFLRLRLDARASLAVATFWWVAMAISMMHALSGGNAEGALIAFTTAAVVALLIESREDALEARFFAALMIAGAVATKAEASVSWALLTLAVVARDLRWRKTHVIRRIAPLVILPGITAALWILFKMIYRIPIGDPTREAGLMIHSRFFGDTVSAMMRHLEAGSFGLPWILPPLFALLARGVLRRESWMEALPALAVTIGLLLGFAAHYLHSSYNPTELIGWTFPRLSQPALSAWISAFGVLAFRHSLPAVKMR
jgi:hypothetical protein